MGRRNPGCSVDLLQLQLEIVIAGGSTLFRIARFTAGIFFLTAGLGGCALLVPQTEALRQAMPVGLPDRIELSEVPFFPQKDYQCGPAALATVLAKFEPAPAPIHLVHAGTSRMPRKLRAFLDFAAPCLRARLRE